MISASIIIFGGKADQVYQLIQLLPSSYAISLYPLDYHLDEIKIHPGSSLILIIPKHADKKGLFFLKTIRERLPYTPILFVAEAPGREEIIQAFRFGVTDYLLFPLQVEIFLPAIESHIKKKAGWHLPRLFQRWRGRLNQWMNKPKPTKFAKLLAPPLDIRTNDFPFKGPDKEKSPYKLEAQLFGPLKIEIGGKRLPIFPGEKNNALVAYFLYHHGKPIHREKLLAKFWGYTCSASARNSLNVATHNIRRHLQNGMPGIELLHYENSTYMLNPELEIFTDTDQFLLNWKQGRRIDLNYGLEKAFSYYQKAASSYKADFLENIHYEEWCDIERDNLKEKYLMILDRLSAHFFQNADFRSSVSIFQKILEKDICLETVHRKLILCYCQLGQRDKAIKQYYKCTGALKKELSIEPSQLTKELFQLIKAEKNIPSFKF